MRVDFVDVLSQLLTWRSLNVLDLLETTALNEGSLGLEVLWKDLGELSADVGQNVVRSELEEGLEGWEVGAHLNDVLKSLLGFVLKVLGAFGKHVHSKES